MVKDCPSFIEKDTKDANDLKLLLQYVDEDPNSEVEESISKAVDRILSDYENKYKVLIVGIARRKIKSIIKMVDIVDAVLDKLAAPSVVAGMQPSQAIRLLSELNQSLNSELDTTRQRIDELQAKGTLTFTEKEELENLQNQNAELDRQKSLLESIQALKKDEVNKAFVQTMEKSEVVFLQVRDVMNQNIQL